MVRMEAIANQTSPKFRLPKLGQNNATVWSDFQYELMQIATPHENHLHQQKDMLSLSLRHAEHANVATLLSAKKCTDFPPTTHFKCYTRTSLGHCSSNYQRRRSEKIQCKMISIITYRLQLQLRCSTPRGSSGITNSLFTFTSEMIKQLLHMYSQNT